MRLSPDEFYNQAITVGNDQGRLPLSRMTEWGISPFQPDRPLVAPLQPPVLPEPACNGEDLPARTTIGKVSPTDATTAAASGADSPCSA